MTANEINNEQLGSPSEGSATAQSFLEDIGIWTRRQPNNQSVSESGLTHPNSGQAQSGPENAQLQIVLTPIFSMTGELVQQGEPVTRSSIASSVQVDRHNGNGSNRSDSITNSAKQDRFHSRNVEELIDGITNTNTSDPGTEIDRGNGNGSNRSDSITSSPEQDRSHSRNVEELIDRITNSTDPGTEIDRGNGNGSNRSDSITNSPEQDRSPSQNVEDLIDRITNSSDPGREIDRGNGNGSNRSESMTNTPEQDRSQFQDLDNSVDRITNGREDAGDGAAVERNASMINDHADISDRQNNGVWMSAAEGVALTMAQLSEGGLALAGNEALSSRVPGAQGGLMQGVLELVQQAPPGTGNAAVAAAEAPPLFKEISALLNVGDQDPAYAFGGFMDLGQRYANTGDLHNASRMFDYAQRYLNNIPGNPPSAYQYFQEHAGPVQERLRAQQ